MRAFFFELNERGVAFRDHVLELLVPVRVPGKLLGQRVFARHSRGELFLQRVAQRVTRFFSLTRFRKLRLEKLFLQLERFLRFREVCVLKVPALQQPTQVLTQGFVFFQRLGALLRVLAEFFGNIAQA